MVDVGPKCTAGGLPERNPKSDLVWRRVADALENERAIDLQYRKTSTTLLADDPIPNFKVMKQLAVQAQLGPLYRAAVVIAPLLVLLAVPLQWIRLTMGAILGTRKNAATSRNCRVLATTIDNRILIDAALDMDEGIRTLPRRPVALGLHALGAELGACRAMWAVVVHGRLLRYLLGRPSGERRDLLLHARDALALVSLTLLASASDDTFATDDHYQRWAHLLSHASRDLRVVQHGFLDDLLDLPHRGGQISMLYLRDRCFLSAFERFYVVRQYRTFIPNSSFVSTPLSSNAVLLASSFPSIDAEIALIDAIHARSRAPVIVKFHPAHRYDSRREALVARASLVYEDQGNPACRVFVSHRSFMEFNYINQGVFSVSIARSGGVEAACAEILAYLERDCIRELDSDSGVTVVGPDKDRDVQL